MTMKRGRMEQDDGEVEAMAMANCLVLLSQVGERALSGHRVFTCKTCNRQFSSFQALGGHRASHNRPKLLAAPTSSDFMSSFSTDHHHNNNNLVKPKTHACSICGDEFPIGQALGGHMRRHRTTTTTTNSAAHRNAAVSTESTSDKRPVLKMDLNLTPFENCVKFGSSVLLGIV